MLKARERAGAHTVDLPLAPAPNNNSLTSFAIFFSSCNISIAQYLSLQSKHGRTWRFGERAMPYADITRKRTVLTSLKALSIARLLSSAGPSADELAHAPIPPLSSRWVYNVEEIIRLDERYAGGAGPWI
jgi:hypothetical protein